MAVSAIPACTVEAKLVSSAEEGTPTETQCDFLVLGTGVALHLKSGLAQVRFNLTAAAEFGSMVPTKLV